MSTRVGRAFVAVVPPPDVLDAVARVIDPRHAEADHVRWTSRTQWHLTLQFLGAVGDLEAVIEGVRSACVLAPFGARLGGGGAFPSPLHASVLWLGLVRGADALSGLAGTIADALLPFGFEPDDRGFHPHLTLARLKRPRNVREIVEALGETPIGRTWTVADVVVLESRTERDGARYEELGRCPLSGG